MLRASSRLCLGILLFGFSVANANPRPRMPDVPKKSSVPNLIDESSRLQVLQEAPIQKDIERARVVYGIGYGVMSAKKLQILANDRLVRYNDVSRPGIVGNIGYFPIHFFGFFGLIGNVSYNYGENSTLVKTALHWVAADLSLGYRFELTERALVKPLLALGGGYNALIQRGPSYYNSSEARGIAVGTFGLNFNLNRTLGFQSPLMWELTARYRKVIDSEDRGINFNGEHYALGLELAL